MKEGKDYLLTGIEGGTRGAEPLRASPLLGIRRKVRSISSLVLKGGTKGRSPSEPPHYCRLGSRSPQSAEPA
ncbi:MAG: hypothetical protein KatS3mg057_0278 [Herpetosiphonaceae bacterium]|nr:MAG: hypothetical protein KatS3mg057_0278 [Herpetosiphonaceae bacterium]